MHYFIRWIFVCLAMPLGNATTFYLPDDTTRVVGHNLIVFSRAEDTLLDIGRRFDIGYSEMASANPGVDIWLPGSGQRVLVPNQFILPAGSQKGIVINLAEMRLYYYPKQEAGQPKKVITHPIGIGREGWKTPLGKTKIIQKKKNPTWTVPESVLAEHLANGDPLPKVVPAGPDNPLGAFKMRLGMPGYLLHGTNRPYGVGLRVSHGCIRLYPEDIEHLFGKVPLNTEVEIVYEPFKAAMYRGTLYVEAHEVYKDMEIDENNMTPVVKAIMAEKDKLYDGDWVFARTMIEEHLGVSQAIEQFKNGVVEGVWFIHSGVTNDAKKKLNLALVTLDFESYFWPLRGAAGEVLIGPFDSQQQANEVAEEVMQLTGESVWTSLMPGEVL
jgi:L,D-transpeptidase ErfK/SrfK